MGVKRPLHYRFPELECSFTQGGTHIQTTGSGLWQTAFEFTGKRGTMLVRHCSALNRTYTWGAYMRITIDGVAYPINAQTRTIGAHATWIFDFNKSVKVEHRSSWGNNNSRLEWAYYEYIP